MSISNKSHWTVAVVFFVHLGSLSAQNSISVSDRRFVLPYKQRLIFDKGCKDEAYRQQLLDITPLGSSHETVMKFVKAELESEAHPSDSLYDGFSKRPNTPKYIGVETRLKKEFIGRTDFSRRIIEREKPHASTILTQLGFIEGTTYMYVHFASKPSWLDPWIVITAMYVFDDTHTLIDIYSFVAGRGATGP